MPESNGNSSNPKIDISLLQTFHLVAKTGSFSAAARELNISYQSAANHVRRLEQLYGTKLVEAEKGSRQVTLTAPGRALHASLGAELDTILARISLLMRDVHSVMRVGVPQALFHHFFPRVVSTFRARHPDTQLTFYERDTTLETMMRQGELDACVSERFFGEPGIAQMLLGEYRLALVYPTEWNNSPHRFDDISDMKDKPFITYEPGQTIRARAQDFLTSAFGEAPKISTSASGCTSMMAMVKEGVGYAVVPEWVVDTSNSQLSCKVLDDLQTVKVYFGCSAFLERDAFIADLREICRDLMSNEFAGGKDPDDECDAM
jgi:LysR family transcriptional regulator, low CO2-responsive transcriptional regulator